MTDDNNETLVITDPYRPPVREMAPNNLPFVTKCREEFPTVQEGLSYVPCVKTMKTHI